MTLTKKLTFFGVARLLLSLLFFSSFSAHAGKLLMGVLGDSISAATLADLPLPLPLQSPLATTNATHLKLPKNFLELRARFLWENKSRLSWASGKSIPSHFLLLREALKKTGESRPLSVSNLAQPGNRSADLLMQANELVRQFKKGESRDSESSSTPSSSTPYDELVYVTLLIGANDACAGSALGTIPPEKMRENILQAAAALAEIKQEKPIRLLILGLPRIPDLADPTIRTTTTLFGLSCTRLRDDVLRFCDPLLSWKTEEEYQARIQDIERRNEMLKAIAEEIRTRHPNIDARYSGHLYQAKLSAQMLAADCFHPSRSGQSEIALNTWQDQPWYPKDLRVDPLPEEEGGQ